MLHYKPTTISAAAELGSTGNDNWVVILED